MLDKKEMLGWKALHKDMSKQGIMMSFLSNLQYLLSKDEYSATVNDKFWAYAIAIRDRLIERWIATQQRYHQKNLKRVYYLSMEFLIGRLLSNYSLNLGIEKEGKAALEALGLNFEEIQEQELDAGLGNGGLGRLAACFLDSLSTLGIPAHGYGIRFDYGIFNQKIRDGYQVELPDEWLRLGLPWEFARLEYALKVHFYGNTERSHDKDGKLRVQWVNTRDVLAVPYDIPVPGYKNNVVNTLRLWSAKSTEDFDFEYFKDGDYERAVQKKILSENISKVLYPNDDISRGRELRLKQEYFLVAASISDILHRFHAHNADLRLFPDKVAIQLNDTHPALAIPELMRVFLDKYDVDWDTAWDITTRTFAYTNHTLMPEALESWPVELLEQLLPRHLQIIYEINARFLDKVSMEFPGRGELLEKMSVIEEGAPKKVRMAHLSIIGSHSVNGVSRLHSELLQSKMFSEFNHCFPGKFNNKTNGVTQRRWLLEANPLLSELITRTIGDKWIVNAEHLEKLLPLKTNSSFRAKWKKVKQENKQILAEYIRKITNITIDPQSLFDIQVKRMHEYKRQLLFGLYVISQYLVIKNTPGKFIQPRTFLMGGKAAPSYSMAKLIIKFINSIADVINRDKAALGKIRLVFLENYRVSLAQRIFPASDLSEQISTAGMEASGTGNMKFMLNGALTIGTMDGANVEIAEAAGEENIFIFGLGPREIEQLRNNGYSPQEYINRSPMLYEIVHLLNTNYFSAYQPGLFAPIIDSLTNNDPFFICADFDAYCQAQDNVNRAYQDDAGWIKKSIVNTAKAGRFSSDRTIKEYAKEIWRVI
ncbi:MAG: glycogen/starch/alpha-glucan phosphorylase [Candidatus Omnitrophota bacterium]